MGYAAASAEGCEGCVRHRVDVNHPIFYQLCLPAEQAPHLPRLLAVQGIDAATVFPGFDGVVKALEERKYWDP